MNNTITITPQYTGLALRVSRDHSNPRPILTKWFWRLARRQGLMLNEPSVEYWTEREPSKRETFLCASADLFSANGIPLSFAGELTRIKIPSLLRWEKPA